MTFNPSRPRALGLEYRPNAVGQVPIYGDADQLTMAVRSGATETIDHLRVGHFWTGPSNAWRRLWADVYPLTSFGGDDAEITNTFVPNETTFNGTRQEANFLGAWWQGTTDNGATFSVGGTQMHTVLDDANDADWGRLPGLASPPGANAENSLAVRSLGLRFTAGAMPTGRRILAIYFDFRGKIPSLNLAPVLSRAELWKAGNRVAVLSNSMTWPFQLGGDIGWPTTTIGPFYMNPETQLPWSITDVQAWDTSYELRVGITPSGLNLSSVAMRVISVPERRVAWGWGAPDRFKSSGVEWAENEIRTDAIVSLQSNDTAGSNWSKVSGTDYVVVLRRLGYFDATGQSITVGTPSVRWLRSGGENPHRDGQVFAADVTVDGRLRALRYLSGLAAPIWLVRTDNVMSVDSQPYQGADFIPVNSTSGFVARQTVVPDDARTYATVKGVVGYAPGAEPTADLQARVVRVSDSAILGTAGPLTFTDFIDLQQETWMNASVPNLRLAEATIQLAGPATLAAGVTYYVEFISTTPATNPWYVLSLRNDNPTGVVGDQSAPGTGTVAATGTADLATVLLDRPAPPGTITATLAPGTLTAPVNLSCSVGTEPRVQVSWSVTALGSLFGYYEIERNDDGVWRTVRRVHTEATTSWVDREMLGNVAVQYRIRVVRADGGVSVYATAAGVTPVQAVGTFRLMSNALQTGVTVVKLTVADAWLFPTSANAELRELYNRDLSVIVRQTEKLGTQRDVPVLVWGDPNTEHPSGAGARAFDPLRTLLENPLTPYVCVITDEGERIYGHVSLPSAATRNRQAHLYLVTLHVEQTSYTPAVVE